MKEFLEICKYFEITPSQFFDMETDDPILLQNVITELKKLNFDDMSLILSNIQRLTK